MARIVADYGEVRRRRNGRVDYVFEFSLDCGCTLSIDRRALLESTHDLRYIAEEAAFRHGGRMCTAVTITPPDEVRQNDALRERWEYEPMWRSGVPTPPPRPSLEESLTQTLMRAYAMPSRSLMPSEAPEEVVRRSAVGFTLEPAPKPPEKKEPEKKPELAARPDRFELIDLD